MTSRNASRLVHEGLLCLFVWFAPGFVRGAERTSVFIGGYLRAIEELASYDVTFSLRRVDYSKSPPGVSPSFVTYRDVYGRGLGRRYERFVGASNQDERLIGWRAATESELGLARALNHGCGLPGMGYLDYCNPLLGTRGINAMFLSECMAADATIVEDLGLMPGHGEVAGFQIHHPNLAEVLRVWLDATHSYMPARIEWCATVGGRLTHRQTMRVSEFAQTAGGGWVPALANWDLCLDESIIDSNQMRVDLGLSSWNEVTSDKLFQERSLPDANHAEAGWQYYYPTSVLPIVRASYEGEQARFREISGAGHLARLAWTTVIIAPVLFVLWRVLRVWLPRR